MNFFERQNQARRRTKLFLFYFVPAVALIVLAVALVTTLCVRPQAALVVGARFDRERHFNFGPPPTGLFLWVSAGTLMLIAGASLYKARELAEGGSVVARAVGGRLVKPGTLDPDEKRLRDVVEEMAIASGVPVPEIYILPEEQGINAFVAGHTASDAALGVTQGAVKLLNRDELQAVVGHEFSHLLNGDMRLNLWMTGLLYGILCISIIGRMLVRMGGQSSGRNRRGGGGVLLGLGLLVIGSVGYFSARLIRAAVSRQREHLADAASVQFTRNPLALAGALKKVGGLSMGSRIMESDAEEFAHLFFGNALKESWLRITSTHPPLVERIRLLDPSFDGNFEVVKSWAGEVRSRVAPVERSSVVPPLIRPGIGQVGVATLLAQSGPAPQHLVYAVGLKDSLPSALDSAARQPASCL